MARKFLYFVAFLIVLVVAGAIVLSQFSGKLTRLALVPTTQFAAPPALATNAYADPAMWFSRPGKANDPSRWLPQGFSGDEGEVPPFAVFFVHPTSYLDRSHWNAPLDDPDSQWRARLFVQGLASAFGQAAQVWAPRYRQATFGAFLADTPEAHRASDAAFHDVDQAFTEFLAQVPPDMPIVLAGHSQGAMHVLRLLQERVAGTPLQARIAAAYPVGWAISREHDLTAYGLPECAAPEQGGCLAAWSSFAEPAEADDWLELYRKSPGLDGKLRGESPIVCTNPLTGRAGGAAPASANRGTLVPDAALSNGILTAGTVPARCDARGLLLIGPPPALGPYVLPGNNYHVYDIPLFWANLRVDVANRVRAWAKTH
jgi:hypothetical protein